MNSKQLLGLHFEDLSIKDYISLIYELPPIANLPIATHNQVRLLTVTKGFYKGISLWLRVLILGEEIPNELFHYAHYRPMAELIKAELDLAIGTYLQSELLQKYFKDAAFLWFLVMIEDSIAQRKKAGLDGDYFPLPGKNEHCTFFTWFRENIEADNIGREQNPTTIKPVNGINCYLRNLLHSEAYQIKLFDKSFKKRYYDPFWKAHKHYNSYTRRCPNLQFYHIDEAGDIVGTGGKGRGNRKL